MNPRRLRTPWRSLALCNPSRCFRFLRLHRFRASARAEPLDYPIALGSIGTPRIAWAVSVVGTRAYVAYGDAGLRVIDSIATPEPGAP